MTVMIWVGARSRHDQNFFFAIFQSVIIIMIGLLKTEIDKA